MDALLYRDILVFDFFPFMAAKFNFDCILHQDNDGKHASNLCKAILKDNDINWVTNGPDDPRRPRRQIYTQIDLKLKFQKFY